MITHWGGLILGNAASDVDDLGPHALRPQRPALTGRLDRCNRDLIALLTPPAKRSGNKRTVDLREVANSLMYVSSTGCQWRTISEGGAPHLRGQHFRTALEEVINGLDVESVKRSDQARGLVVLPKRWLVERTFAYPERCHWLAIGDA